jgi:serine/threonine protein kinase
MSSQDQIKVATDAETERMEAAAEASKIKREELKKQREATSTLSSLGSLLIRIGNLLKPSPFPPCSLEQFSKNPDLSDSERKRFLNFIEPMIRLDPEERLDASKLLESAWLGYPCKGHSRYIQPSYFATYLPQ